MSKEHSIDGILGAFELGLMSDETISDAARTKAYYKDLLKKLMLEIIGDDDPITDYRHYSTDKPREPAASTQYAVTRNNLRRELRKKVSEL